jgi:predicted PurR-regulated permease PerM
MRELLRSLEVELGGWIRVRIVLFFFVALVTFLMLSIFGVPYALSLGVVAGLLDVVMLIGPIFAAVPGVILALTYNGWGNALLVTMFYVIIQNVENLFIAPRLIHQQAHVSPVVGILGVVSGWQLFGWGGAFLAIPMIIILQTVVRLVVKEVRGRERSS